MGNDVDWGNIAVGFGGVFVLGLIGAAVHWYLGRREQDQRRNRPDYPAGPRPGRPTP